MNEQIVKDTLSPIFEKYDIEKVWLFGSFLSGDYNDQSDIDIVYERNQHFSFDDELNIFNFIKELQANNLHREVDVTNIKNLHKDSKIVRSIKKEMKLIYQKGRMIN